MKTIGKDETVYFQSSPANSVYFLKKGKIKISHCSPEGKEFLVSILEPGEIFGESFLNPSNFRKDAAIAEEEATFCVMSSSNMKKLLLMVPELNLKFTQLIESRLEKLQKRLEDVSLKSNRERILEFLKESALPMAERFGKKLVINNNLTHDKIAQLTSTNRQEVSSVFSSLKKEGIIDYDRKEIHVKDLERLLQLT
ncbi:Crp/Fnr family transcriptional regulator [Christiangramia fulva]|uniref:Crp/Fnr family transcriptional regulator n=1 Tax=Christiangramia fulva TaxID=2126553 RepID=UPI001D052AE5|nr:Crp/Fnr family transcriptional regulator [Christiangramia fulva]